MALCKRHSYGTCSSQPGPCCMCEGERQSAVDRKQFVQRGFGDGRRRKKKPVDVPDEAEGERAPLQDVSLSIEPGFGE